MNMRCLWVLVLIAMVIFIHQTLAEDSRIEKAKELFERLVSLSHKFDESVADLYSDDAVIKNIRRYPFFGETREMTMSGQKFKYMIPTIMPLAKARGDISTFSDISYSVEGDKVIIRATRYSKMKNYSSPYLAVVGPDNNGNWLIFEEVTESRP